MTERDDGPGRVWREARIRPTIPRSMRFSPLLAVTLALALGACRSTPDPLPAGRGLVAIDAEPPPNAAVYEAPRWSEGDRFVYARAGVVRIPLRVELSKDGYELVHEASGGRTSLSAALGERGERAAGSDEWTLRFDPEDVPLSWPLWVGKRWGAEFTNRNPDRVGAPDLPFVASYLCDAEEQVQVPAGTFRALRIWRRSRLAAKGDFEERVAIDWYAPEIGAVVRSLENGIETVLVEARRR